MYLLLDKLDPQNLKGDSHNIFHTNRAYIHSPVKPQHHFKNIKSEEKRSSTHQRRYPMQASVRYTPAKFDKGAKLTGRFTSEKSQENLKTGKFTVFDRRKKNYSMGGNAMVSNDLNVSLITPSANIKQLQVSPRLREENSMLGQSHTSFNA